MNAPIPQQPQHTNTTGRIFAEILSDFKALHAIGNEDFRGNFTVEDKLFKLSDVFEVYQDAGYQARIKAEAADFVFTLLETLLEYAADQNDLSAYRRMQKRYNSWIKGTPLPDDVALLGDVVKHAFYLNCLKASRPDPTETLSQCRFVQEIAGHLQNLPAG